MNINDRFDDTSRILASAIPRRQAVKLITAVLAGGTTWGLLWPKWACADVLCTDGTHRCPNNQNQCCTTPVTGVFRCCPDKEGAHTRCCNSRGTCCLPAPDEVCCIGRNATICCAAPTPACCGPTFPGQCCKETINCCHDQVGNQKCCGDALADRGPKCCGGNNCCKTTEDCCNVPNGCCQQEPMTACCGGNKCCKPGGVPGGTECKGKNKDGVCLKLTTGRWVRQSFAGIPREEHFVTIQNGSPGLQVVYVVVNRSVFKVDDLGEGEETTLDVSSAMQAGDNTLILIGRGKPGASVVVVVSDSVDSEITIDESVQALGPHTVDPRHARHNHAWGNMINDKEWTLN